MKEINVQSANDLFELLATYGGKVVNTETLSTLDINQAWASKRIWIDAESFNLGLGYVWIPIFKDTFPETLEEVELFENCYPLGREFKTASSSFLNKQSQIIQEEYEKKMSEKEVWTEAALPAEDVLQRPVNYSLYQIFDRLKAGRKRLDQLLLQNLMDHLSSTGTFDIIDSKDLDDYNTIVTLLIEKHRTIFQEADVSYKFKKEQLLNRGYSPEHILY